MAIASLSTTFSISTFWNAAAAASGTGYPALTSGPATLSKGISTSQAVANNVAGGADEFISKIYSVPASNHTDVDLTALTDILNTGSVTLARLKGLVIQLLSTSDDAVNGTAAVSIAVGNSGTNDFLGPLGGTTPTITIKNGGWYGYSDPSAAGWTVDGTHKIVRLTNNDAGVAAAVRVTLVGGST